MKVFVTWAGSRSYRAAQAVAEWLNKLFPDVDAWFSPQIEKGTAWFDAIHRSLDSADLGIACVTSDNFFRSDWLHYEVGYLRGRKVQVKPFLLDVRSEDLRRSPLGQFQHTVFTREDLVRLCREIDAMRPEQARFSADNLRDLFEARFAGLEESLQEARDMVGTHTDTDILWQILARVTQIQRSIFGEANTPDTVLSRGLNDYSAPHVATIEEMVRLIRDPDSYTPPQWPLEP